MPIINGSDDDEEIDHVLFTNQNSFFQWNERKLTTIHFHLFLAFIGILCILSALGGHYVDDDLVFSPFVNDMRTSSVGNLRITTMSPE